MLVSMPFECVPVISLLSAADAALQSERRALRGREDGTRSCWSCWRKWQHMIDTRSLAALNKQLQAELSVHMAFEAAAWASFTQCSCSDRALRGGRVQREVCQIASQLNSCANAMQRSGEDLVIREAAARTGAVCFARNITKCRPTYISLVPYGLT